MSGQHKDTPQSVRMPGGLKEWYRERASSRGQSLNSLLVAALVEFRARHNPAASDLGGQGPRVKVKHANAPAVAREPESTSDIMAALRRRNGGQE